jgi:competence protein ComEA
VLALWLCALSVLALSVQRPLSAPPSTIAPAAAPAPPQPSAGARALLEGRPLDLNRASAGELALLPGIGLRLAERIVADRQARGPFRSVQDLERVRGVGPGKRRAVEAMLGASK